MQQYGHNALNSACDKGCMRLPGSLSPGWRASVYGSIGAALHPEAICVGVPALGALAGSVCWGGGLGRHAMCIGVLQVQVLDIK
jgi:hypothetical protein